MGGKYRITGDAYPRMRRPRHRRRLVLAGIGAVVVLGLVVGKTVGIFGGTYLAARFTRAELNKDLAWADVFALAPVYS
ncbi:hypothetical protein ACZ90_60425 [Streptomyces albus subsp. albus]|nr:hypothetical protein ACZ90_60425 [Streptomyces albus subsp. albus]